MIFDFLIFFRGHPKENFVFILFVYLETLQTAFFWRPVAPGLGSDVRPKSWKFALKTTRPRPYTVSTSDL